MTFNRFPRTLEEFMISAEAQQFNEQVNGGKTAPELEIVMTVELMKDIVRRIRRLENRHVV